MVPTESAALRTETVAKNAPVNCPLFREGDTCWRQDRVSHAAVIVDCANYYRALHESICQARYSVFILGWDIDSRIELLRGKDKKQTSCPSRLFELLQWKARETPGIQIYLNRWDYSFAMAGDREGLSLIRWKLHSPENIHYCLDSMVPIGACHHQKIIVIDDEIAFCGGMDIALIRWDRRQHKPFNRLRKDPGGTYAPITEQEFGPYHDIQVIYAGPMVRHFAEWARKRWQIATGKEAILPRRGEEHHVPPIWPESVARHFCDIRGGIALTMPRLSHQPGHREIEPLYLEMIQRAKRFIYIENQYLTCTRIADALRQQLEQQPHLRILMVSSRDPQGVFERLVLWYGRYHFRKRLERGDMKQRIVLAYPACRDGTLEKPVHIHSKLMIVDDSLLRVGSANLNQRSMGMDSECDVTLEASTNEHYRTIAAIRNDLIREHTGMPLKQIERVVQGEEPLQTVLHEVHESQQHLRQIDDSAYRGSVISKWLSMLVDSDSPVCHAVVLTSRTKRRIFWAICLLVFVSIAAQYAPTETWASSLSPEGLARLMQGQQYGPWGMMIGLGAYMAGSLLFLPHFMLTAAAVMLFSPQDAFAVAMGGSLLGSALGYAVGRRMGERFWPNLLGNYLHIIKHHAEKSGVMEITVLRMMPLAPYMVVNLVLGMTKVPLFAFLMGTTLALAPGTAAFCLLGHSLTALLQDPNFFHSSLAVGGVLLWGCIVGVMHYMGKQWQKRTGHTLTQPQNCA